MEELKQAMTPPQASPTGTFSVKIENTTYVVGVHFSQTTKDTLEDKMKHLIVNDVKSVNF